MGCSGSWDSVCDPFRKMKSFVDKADVLLQEFHILG